MMKMRGSNGRRARRGPQLVFQPAVGQAMQAGAGKLAATLAPSLGPLPRTVAVIHKHEHDRPEVLDSGGDVVRQVLQLADRTEDVGAMFLRECLWRQHLQFGDGVTTAALLFDAVFKEGVRYIAAGGNAMQLRRHLNKGTEAIIDALTEMTTECSGRDQLVALATSMCHDKPLAEMLGEILDDIGEFGRLEIREGRTHELVRERVDGMYWERGLTSRQLAADPQRQRSEFADAAVLISDLEIDEVRQIMPPLALALASDIRHLFIVAQKFSEQVIAFLRGNTNPERLRVAAVLTAGVGADQFGELQHLALATGGKPFIQAAGDTFDRVRPEDFGRAGLMWADIHNFGIVNGAGDLQVVRSHMFNLFAAFERAEDAALREKLRKRIARLQEGSVTLWVGGSDGDAITARTGLAERTAAMLREALMYGVLPGGGSALLACREALESLLARSCEADEQAAYRILLHALKQPCLTIATNAGYDPQAVMAAVDGQGQGCGFDATSGQVVQVAEAGILDSATVLKSAVFTALASAALALTVDVMVLHRNPEQAQPVGAITPKRL